MGAGDVAKQLDDEDGGDDERDEERLDQYQQGGGTPALRDGDVKLWRAMCWCGGPAQVGQWGQLDECGSSESNICGTLGEISQ